jgi:16S rRNA (uracil1498-N3)-methyltransferase
MTRRLYCTEFDIGSVNLTGPEAHHGRNVLRLSPGDEVELFDGRGRFAHARVDKLGKSEILLRVDSVETAEEPCPKIILATAVPKFAHQEILVRMATELGVNLFAPVVFERSSVREQFRPEKWQRWVIEACKQCRAQYLPEVASPVRLSDFIQTLSNTDLLIYGDTAMAQNPLTSQQITSAGRVVIFISPEGGFTESEVDVLRQAGAFPLRIGRQILRIETAAIALTTAALLLTSGTISPRP